jgi:hypothetical protein
MGLAAVAALNAVFLLVGFALLRGLRVRVRWFDAGLALVLGAGLAGSLVLLAVILGARANLRTLAAVLLLLLVAAVASARLLRLPSTPPPGRRPDLPAASLGAAAAAVALLGIVGGFRSAPWLDDAWGIWLPKAVALLHHGLDARVFAPSDVYVAFEVPDYPLWWSALAALDMRVAGDVDVRVMNVQLGLLAAGYLAAAARLLWNVARPWLVSLAVALVAFSPEFWRHAQGGMADLPLAIYVSLAALAGAAWLRQGHPAHLILAAAFAAVALQVKGEALVELAVLLIVGVLLADGRRRPLALAGIAAFASAVPWLVWQRLHDVPARTPLGDALDPTYLADRTDRVWPSVEEVVSRALDPADWLLIVPLLIVTAAAAAVRTGRAEPPGALAVVAGFAAFLVWAYWANRDELNFLLATSAYRVVDPLVLTAAVLVPLTVEPLLRPSAPTRPRAARLAAPGSRSGRRASRSPSRSAGARQG